MGAKTVEEIVGRALPCSFNTGCDALGNYDARKGRCHNCQARDGLVNDLRAAGLLLEPGQRERIIDRLRFWVAHLEGQGVVGGEGETATLLRELAGAGEPANVGAPSSQERATGEDRAGGTAGTASQPSSRPHEPAPVVDENCVACTKPDVFAVHLCKGRREPAPVVDEREADRARGVDPECNHQHAPGEVWGLIPCPECWKTKPAPPASAPRRMVNAIDGEHDEDPQCAGIRCRPVEPPTVRRMRGNPTSPAISRHAREHTEDDECGSHPACQPVAPSSTEAAGPSPECRHDWIAVDGGSRCVKCKDTRASRVAPTQPPHVHQWAAVAWSSDHLTQTSGPYRQVYGIVTRVTREHCVADGCTNPPATREVSHA